MKKYFPNSDFKVDTYFKKNSFIDQMNQSFKAGKYIYFNSARVLNNCSYSRKLKGAVSLKEIFSRYWSKFKEMNYDKLGRNGLIDNIENFISCKDFSKGYQFFECTNCNNFILVPFTCKSRFCPSCGNKYRDQRTEKISEVILEIPHRQFVFTVPYELRIHFRHHREMLSFLFKAVNETFNIVLKRKAPLAYKSQQRRPGIISFVHTFGRDLKWHPHIHALVAEKYSDKDGNLHNFNYFHFNFIRKTFMFSLFSMIRNHYRTHYPKEFKKMCFLLKNLQKIYPYGFYVYGPQTKNSTLKTMKALTNYIVRYAAHPAISEKRILNIDYETNRITWFYDPHEDDDIKDEEQKHGRQIIEEDIFEFIKKIIIHVPDKYFNQVRYYGFYARKSKFTKLIKQNCLFPVEELNRMLENTRWINGLKNNYGYSPLLCFCGHQMVFNHNLSFFPKRRKRKYG